LPSENHGASRELQVVIRIRPIDLAAVVSVLLHAAIFFFVQVKPPPDPKGPESQAPLNVVLAPPQAEPAEAVAPPSAPSAPPLSTPTPPPRTTAPRPAAPRQPPVIARTPTPLAPRFPPVPLPTPIEGPRPLPRPPEPQVDMMAAIQARRAQRAAADAALARGAPSKEPTDPAERNLQTLSGHEGVGGVFQVLRKGVRTGEFAFNGFRRESQRKWREVIEVDAGTGGNLELAMIRRMIDLIRTHYTGDFQWDSHRLGRVVVLSARPADQPGLEEFLMKEFFGSPVVKPSG
jgi:hypothetical protein